MRTDILAQAMQIRESMDAAASVLTDNQAIKASRIYPLWKTGISVTEGERYYYSVTDRLYKVREGKSHTTQSDWTPDVTPDLWAIVEATHTGTQDDPITAARGMEYVYGLYYLDEEDSNIYLCERSGEASGGTITLQYLPHELVGNYFTKV